MYNGDWFDKAYFEYTPGETYKSNYARIQGGYKPEMAKPQAFVLSIIKNMPIDLLKTPDPMTILEIGCATGSAVLTMRQLGIDAYGVDASSYILGKASKEVRPFLCCLDMRELLEFTYPDFIERILDGRTQIAAIVSKDVLEHVTEDLIDDILIEFSILANWQYHMINTGQRPDQAADGDQSHFLLRPIEWWQGKAKELGINATFEET